MPIHPNTKSVFVQYFTVPEKIFLDELTSRTLLTILNQKHHSRRSTSLKVSIIRRLIFVLRLYVMNERASVCLCTCAASHTVDQATRSTKKMMMTTYRRYSTAQLRKAKHRLKMFFDLVSLLGRILTQ